MHFKRKGPKSTRSGCMMCKPHKRQGAEYAARSRFSAVRRMLSAAAQLKDDGLVAFDVGVR